eukprot:TRINITY_DN22155_c0_g1_i1.p1 TRINITY_DN22155_c0_g1~~TRINITY_DN22155_c0_g1_i1.p1  ORF type:complete len:565 (-),score=112.06 TRINITY_DN22155_c0_g1_i1:192-1886(-)
MAALGHMSFRGGLGSLAVGGEHVNSSFPCGGAHEASGVNASLACLRGSRLTSDGKTSQSGPTLPSTTMTADSLRFVPTEPHASATQRLWWVDEARQAETSRPLDAVTRASLAEARAERAEAELLRTRINLEEAQQRYRDSNQLLKHLGDANASLRGELERLRSQSTELAAKAPVGDTRSETSGSPNGPATANSQRFQHAVSPLRLGSLRREGSVSTRPRSNVGGVGSAPSCDEEGGACSQRCISSLCSKLHSPGELSTSASGAAFTASCDASSGGGWTERSEVPSLRHRVWALERELQEAKRLLAAFQKDGGRWRERCIFAEEAQHEEAEEASARTRTAEKAAATTEASAARALLRAKEESTAAVAAMALARSARQRLAAAIDEEAVLEAALRHARKEERREAEVNVASRWTGLEKHSEAELAVAWSRNGHFSEVLAEVADMEEQNLHLREECKALHTQVSDQIATASFVEKNLELSQQRSVAAEKAMSLLSQELEVERQRHRGEACASGRGISPPTIACLSEDGSDEVLFGLMDGCLVSPSSDFSDFPCNRPRCPTLQLSSDE